MNDLPSLTVQQVFFDPDFSAVPEEERGLFGFGTRRRVLERLAYGAFLLKREHFMFKGRINRLGETFLRRSAPEYVNYTHLITDNGIEIRIAQLEQEIEFLRSSLRLQAQIEKKKREPIKS